MKGVIPVLRYAERLDSLGERRVCEDRVDAGGFFFFFFNPTRSPKLAAELIRGGAFVLCYA